MRFKAYHFLAIYMTTFKYNHFLVKYSTSFLYFLPKYIKEQWQFIIISSSSNINIHFIFKSWIHDSSNNLKKENHNHICIKEGPIMGLLLLSGCTANIRSLSLKIIRRHIALCMLEAGGIEPSPLRK